MSFFENLDESGDVDFLCRVQETQKKIGNLRNGESFVASPTDKLMASAVGFGPVEEEGDEEDDFFKEFRLDDLDTPPPPLNADDAREATLSKAKETHSFLPSMNSDWEISDVADVTSGKEQRETENCLQGKGVGEASSGQEKKEEEIEQLVSTGREQSDTRQEVSRTLYSVIEKPEDGEMVHEISFLWFSNVPCLVMKEEEQEGGMKEVQGAHDARQTAERADSGSSRPVELKSDLEAPESHITAGNECQTMPAEKEQAMDIPVSLNSHDVLFSPSNGTSALRSSSLQFAGKEGQAESDIKQTVPVTHHQGSDAQDGVNEEQKTDTSTARLPSNIPCTTLPSTSLPQAPNQTETEKHTAGENALAQDGQKTRLPSSGNGLQKKKPETRHPTTAPPKETISRGEKESVKIQRTSFRSRNRPTAHGQRKTEQPNRPAFFFQKRQPSISPCPSQPNKLQRTHYGSHKSSATLHRCSGFSGTTKSLKKPPKKALLVAADSRSSPRVPTRAFVPISPTVKDPPATLQTHHLNLTSALKKPASMKAAFLEKLKEPKNDAQLSPIPPPPPPPSCSRQETPPTETNPQDSISLALPQQPADPPAVPAPVAENTQQLNALDTSVTEDFSSLTHQLELVMLEAKLMREQILETRVRVAIQSNKLIRLHNPLIAEKLSRLKAKAEAALQAHAPNETRFPVQG